MRRLALLLLIVAMSPWVRATDGCGIEAAPRAGIAPIRYVRVKVMIDDRRGGEVGLVGPQGLETSSLVQPGSRTTWIEWKNITLGPGEYAVIVQTSGGCTSRDRINVVGSE